MSIYDRIKDLCKRRGISVRELESSMGFSYGSIAKWKNHSPAYYKIQKVADYFGVQPRMLTDDDTGYYENPETALIAQKIFENPDLRILFDAASDAKPEDIHTTYDMLMALKRKETVDDDDPA